MQKRTILICAFLVSAACSSDIPVGAERNGSPWLLVDDFESGLELQDWVNIDAQNDTDPHVPSPQISEIRVDANTGNRYMIRKPAADGVVGNRSRHPREYQTLFS